MNIIIIHLIPERYGQTDGRTVIAINIEIKIDSLMLTIHKVIVVYSDCRLTYMCSKYFAGHRQWPTMIMPQPGTDHHHIIV